jgi:hypothetical protein
VFYAAFNNISVISRQSVNTTFPSRLSQRKLNLLDMAIAYFSISLAFSIASKQCFTNFLGRLCSSSGMADDNFRKCPEQLRFKSTYLYLKDK